eukprot:scaffold16948_cov116-Isochrysis_galbana.AAC.2
MSHAVASRRVAQRRGRGVCVPRVAGCADERDAREVVALHLTDGGDPPGTAELSGEERAVRRERAPDGAPLWRPAQQASCPPRDGLHVPPPSHAPPRHH